MKNTSQVLSARLGEVLCQRKMKLRVAESCTGGWLASTVVDTSGASQWFDRGFVTYTNTAKEEILGVNAQTLHTYGAVSLATAGEMAIGTLPPSTENHALYWAISTTGIAGPDGGTKEKPVGMVCFGFALYDQQAQLIETQTQYFQGSRTQIREQAVYYALEHSLTLLSSL